MGPWLLLKAAQIRLFTGSKEESMKVKSIMTVDPASCLPDTDLAEVGRLMIENDCGEIPVVETDSGLKPVGVITDRDIVCRAVARRINPLELRAKDCMTAPVLAVGEEASVDECCRLMETHQVRRALVVDGTGALRGIVSQADIARHLAGRKTGEVVREVSQPRGSAARL
jgi:CBS domain-containing protein